MALLAHYERCWSRFIPTSDIGRINAAVPTQRGYETFEVDPSTVVLVGTMQTAYRVTGGRYDPCVLPAVMSAGYVASIDNPVMICTIGAHGDVRVDFDEDAPASVLDVALGDRSLRVPAGLRLDPGGIGKGLAADLAVAHLLNSGAAGALVSIGGDLACAGVPPQAEGWLVTVEDAHDAALDVLTCAISHGGVATSSKLSRRWTDGEGRSRHHLIDHTTGQPAVGDLNAVTVFAGSGWQAEIIATATIIEGSARFGEIDEPDSGHSPIPRPHTPSFSAIACRDDGTLVATADLRHLLTQASTAHLSKEAAA
jgi:thiamine biosynthesis lipoprotein